MTAITFDTHVYVKKLKKAGVPDKQAEAQIEVTAEIMKNFVATKHDLHKLNDATKHDLLLAIANLQTTLTIRMGAMIAGGVTIAIALMTFIFKISGLI